MTGDHEDRTGWLRFSGIGVEFAAAVAGLTLFGYWVDRRYDCAPRGLLVGLILGIVGGGYNLIRQSLSATREAQRKHGDSGSPPHDRT